MDIDVDKIFKEADKILEIKIQTIIKYNNAFVLFYWE